MEKSIYEKAVEAVQNGSRFKVDLVNRSLTIDRKYLIKNGEYEGDLVNFDGYSIKTLEYLYAAYKHSRPSERSDSKRRVYFKALRMDELDDDDMLFGIDREEAQLELELYLLCWVISGLFVWDEETMGKWFWQSQRDKDLVILRSWVEKNK